MGKRRPALWRCLGPCEETSGSTGLAVGWLLIDAVLKMLRDRVVPIAAGRVVSSSMAGVGAEQAFLTAAHRQIIGLMWSST